MDLVVSNTTADVNGILERSHDETGEAHRSFLAFVERTQPCVELSLVRVEGRPAIISKVVVKGALPEEFQGAAEVALANFFDMTIATTRSLMALAAARTGGRLLSSMVLADEYPRSLAAWWILRASALKSKQLNPTA